MSQVVIRQLCVRATPQTRLFDPYLRYYSRSPNEIPDMEPEADWETVSKSPTSSTSQRHSSTYVSLLGDPRIMLNTHWLFYSLKGRRVKAY